MVQSWLHHSPSLCQGRNVHWDCTVGILFQRSRRPFGFGQFYLVLITFSKNQIPLKNDNLAHKIIMIWISDTGKLLMLICSVYLPYNLCLFTADRIFVTWHSFNVPNFGVLVGGYRSSSRVEQHCWIAVVWSAGYNLTGGGSQPISRAGIFSSSFKQAELSVWKPKSCIAMLWLYLVYFHIGRCIDQPYVLSVVVPYF